MEILNISPPEEVQQKELADAIEWAKWQHEENAKMERDGFTCHSIGDLGPEPPRWDQMQGEADYRRGFTHGISYAIDVIQDLHRKGFIRSTEIANILDNWNLSAAYPWRYQASSDVRKGDHSLTCDHPKLKQESWWEIRNRILRRDGGKCVRCGDVLKLQVDHIQTVSDGGLPTDSNLQTLCLPCHVRKGSE